MLRFVGSQMIAHALTPKPRQAQNQISIAKGVNLKDNLTKMEVIYLNDRLDLVDHSRTLTLKYDRVEQKLRGNDLAGVGFIR